MTDTLLRAKSISLGSRVMVSFAPDDTTNDPAKQFDGMEYTVSAMRYLGNRGKYGRLYYLYGCESEFGVPYAFTKDNLILIQ